MLTVAAAAVCVHRSSDMRVNIGTFGEIIYIYETGLTFLFIVCTTLLFYLCSEVPVGYSYKSEARNIVASNSVFINSFFIDFDLCLVGIIHIIRC